MLIIWLEQTSSSYTTNNTCPLLSPLHVLLQTATQMVQPVWPRSGEMRRPRFGHAQLLPSPRKRGGDTALVKQVSDVIGWRVGRCSSVPSFHPSSVSSGKIARRTTGSSALYSGRLPCVHHHLLSAHNIIVHFTSGKFTFSFVFTVHRFTFLSLYEDVVTLRIDRQGSLFKESPRIPEPFAQK